MMNISKDKYESNPMIVMMMVTARRQTMIHVCQTRASAATPVSVSKR